MRWGVGASEQAELLELLNTQQVCLIEDQDHGSAAFAFLGGEHLSGLWDQRGFVETRCPTECGDDPGVEAAAADGGVALVDGGVPGRVEPGQGCADRDGLAGADLTGDHSQGSFADTPADPGDGLGVAGVAVQHLGCQGLTERHARKTVVRLQLGKVHRSSLESLELLGSAGCSDPRRSSWPGMTSWPTTIGYGVGPSRVANDASSASNPTSRPPPTLVVVPVLS